MRRIAAIAAHTFKESVRDKVLYNLIAFALVLMGAAILLGAISVGIREIFLVNLGLSAISLFGLLAAIFIGISLVSKEIERRTIYNVLSKPVSRAEFILGKYCGLGLTVLVNVSIMTAGFYLALFYEERTLDRADLWFLAAVYFILLELAIVVGLALLFSTVSTPILSAVFTFSLFVIGNFLGDMEGFAAQTHNLAVTKLGQVLYYALPNFSSFNVIGGAAHGETVSGYLLLSNTLYALLYVAVLVSGTVLIFEEREFR